MQTILGLKVLHKVTQEPVPGAAVLWASVFCGRRCCSTILIKRPHFRSQWEKVRYGNNWKIMWFLSFRNCFDFVAHENTSKKQEMLKNFKREKKKHYFSHICLFSSVQCSHPETYCLAVWVQCIKLWEEAYLLVFRGFQLKDCLVVMTFLMSFRLRHKVFYVHLLDLLLRLLKRF